MSHLKRLLAILEDASMFLAGLCLAAIMLIVFSDAAMRYLLNAPFSWSYDFVSKYLMIAAMFFALARTLRDGAHINIDFFTQYMSPMVRRISLILCNLAVLPVFCIMFYAGFSATRDAYVDNLYDASLINWPLWPSYIFIPIGVGLLTLRVIVQTAELSADIISRAPDTDNPQQEEIL